MPRGHREDPHREARRALITRRELREKVGRKSQSNRPASFGFGFNEGARGAGAPERKNHITGRQLTAPFRAVSAIN